jgi:hypothetical protein
MRADRMKTQRKWRGLVGSVAGLLLCTLSAAPARAETLLTDTTLVTGTQSSVFSFDAPGPGTITVELTSLNWPQPLSSLNFLATSGNNVLSAWSGSGSATRFFQIGSGGMFFADVTAIAGGPLDVGVYSLSLIFTPATPVPLPAAGGLLLGGCVALLALGWRARRRGVFETKSSCVTGSITLV